MLIIGSRLFNHPVMSLHIGGEAARIMAPIIDPRELKIVAFRVDGPLIGVEAGTILETQDIREVSDVGMIIDSTDVLVNPGEVIRLDEVMKLNFELEGMKVETKSGTKLGKVVDYMVNSKDFMIKQIVVGRPLLKSFLDPELLIGRSQIVEVTDYKIIVKDGDVKTRAEAEAADFVPNFVNPFRKQPALQVQNRNLDEPDTE